MMNSALAGHSKPTEQTFSEEQMLDDQRQEEELASVSDVSSDSDDEINVNEVQKKVIRNCRG